MAGKRGIFPRLHSRKEAVLWAADQLDQMRLDLSLAEIITSPAMRESFLADAKPELLEKYHSLQRKIGVGVDYHTQKKALREAASCLRIVAAHPPDPEHISLFKRCLDVSKKMEGRLSPRSPEDLILWDEISNLAADLEKSLRVSNGSGN